MTNGHEPQRYTCANCGRLIGALEQPNLWGESVVCSQCVALLQTTIKHAGPMEAAKANKTNRTRGKYVNRLFYFQWIMFVLFVLFTALPLVAALKNADAIGRGRGNPDFHPSYIEAYIFFGMWLLSILAGMMLKANWENRKS